MTTVARFDRGEVKGEVIRTDEGYLRADAIITRTGVLIYRNPDGTVRRELRRPADVFHADSLASMKMIPVTNNHPPERLVNADNAKRLSIGQTGENIRGDGMYLRANLVITDAEGIKAVEAGRRELSAGYTTELVREDGVYEGQPYDYVQTNIRYNHIAIVDRARAGGMARLNLDAADAVEIDQPDEGRPMKKVNIDGIEYDAAPEVVNALAKVQSRADSAEATVTTITGDRDRLAAERDSLKERLDAAERVDHTEAINAAVKARVALIGVAARVDAAINCDGMTDLDIKKAVILKKSPKADLGEKSEAYISARFDSIVEELPSAADQNLAEQRRALNPEKRADASHDSVDAARNRMVEKMTGAYKKENV